MHSNLEELQWMAQLVNDMLYLAKADHGLLIPKREPLELGDEADLLLEFFAPFAHRGEIFPQFFEQLLFEVTVAGAAFLETVAHIPDLVCRGKERIKLHDCRSFRIFRRIDRR